MQCDHRTDASALERLGWGRRSGRCSRAATYTDGSRFYCTQHAKEPATMARKASGKIRSGLHRLRSDADVLRQIEAITNLKGGASHAETADEALHAIAGVRALLARGEAE